MTIHLLGQDKEREILLTENENYRAVSVAVIFGVLHCYALWDPLSRQTAFRSPGTQQDRQFAATFGGFHPDLTHAGQRD